MRMRIVRVAVVGVALLGAGASIGYAQGKPAAGGAGGKAAEHRSEQAERNSNAQWSEGATRGQERAAERRSGEAEHEEAEAETKKAPKGERGEAKKRVPDDD